MADAPMATASAGGALSTAAASLVPTPSPTPAPRLLRRQSTKPAPRASLTRRPKKPPPFSCVAAATPTPAPAPASKPAGSWRDLCSLNAWVERDCRLVDSVGRSSRRSRGYPTNGHNSSLRVCYGAGLLVREAVKRRLGMLDPVVEASPRVVGGL